MTIPSNIHLLVKRRFINSI